MTRGKQTCKILKEIRRQIAEANGIELITSECRYKGDCLGTCPKCEAEVRYLEQQLRARSLAGKAMTIAGISAASLAMLIPITAEAQKAPEPPACLMEDRPVTADTVTVSGTVFESDILELPSDGTIPKYPLPGAYIYNKRTKSGAVTDSAGHFKLTACVGDKLEVFFLGFKSQTIVVGENMTNMEVSLTQSEDVMGEVVYVKGATASDKTPYLDLIVTDEKGKTIDYADFEIERIWLDEDGDEDYGRVFPEIVDDEHPCRIYWVYQNGLQNEDREPLKEATFRIITEDYNPVTIKVKYPKRNAKKTIKLKHRKN